MFVYTARLNRKKVYIAVIALVILILTIFFIVSVNSTSAVESLSVSTAAKNNEQRAEYLKSLGWEIDPEPLEEQTIIIPKEFSEIYNEYNALQAEQGFDLTKYAGKEAVRYTYSVLNYPDDSADVVADIIVYRGQVIAGDIQSTLLDGFMATLEYPQK